MLWAEWILWVSDPTCEASSGIVPVPSERFTGVTSSEGLAAAAVVVAAAVVGAVVVDVGVVSEPTVDVAEGVDRSC